MSNLTITPTRNFGLIRSLNETLFGDEYWIEGLTKSHCWIARTESGEIAGFAVLQVVDGGRSAFLSRVGVLRAYRGQGLQKRFIRVRERKAKQLGCEYLITYTDRENLASSNSLIACGYKLYTPERVWGLPRSESLYWWRKVSP